MFTLQSEYDFSSLQTWLYWGLLLLVGTGFVQMFFPYNHAFELGYSVAGCVVFSGYIAYDTWLLQQRYVAPTYQCHAGRLDPGEHLAVPGCREPVSLRLAAYVPKLTQF